MPEKTHLAKIFEYLKRTQIIQTARDDCGDDPTDYVNEYLITLAVDFDWDVDAAVKFYEESMKHHGHRCVTHEFNAAKFLDSVYTETNSLFDSNDESAIKFTLNDCFFGFDLDIPKPESIPEIFRPLKYA